MAFTPESLEMVRDRVDLVDLLQSYLELKPAGTSYKACCPFHSERTPSFMVKKGDHHYHCFGCGAHGDAITFLIQSQGYSFQEAVELLAQKYGVILEQNDTSKKSKSKDRSWNLMQAAQEFFQSQLTSVEGQAACHYLNERGLSLEWANRYGVGYALNHPFALKKHLNKLRFSDAEMLELGLVRASSSSTESVRYRDFFQHRIVFPIHDAMGRVIAFSARKIDEASFGGKYINSPETPLFKKSRAFFAINYSRKRVVLEKQAILVEGQLDALALIDVGLDLALAPLGTAFGLDHVHELSRLGVKKVWIAFDGDDAGLKAAVKVGLLLHASAIDVHIVHLPEQSDPDSFLKNHGVESFIDCLHKSRPFLEFFVEIASSGVDLTSPAAKVELFRSMSREVQQINDPLLAHETLIRISQIMNLSSSVVESFIKDFLSKKKTVSKSEPSSTKTPSQNIVRDGVEADFIRWLLVSDEDQAKRMGFIVDLDIEILLFDKALKKVYSFLKKRFLEGKSLSPTDILSEQKNEKAQEFFSSLMNKKLDFEQSQTLFVKTLNDLKRRHWKVSLQEIRQSLNLGQLSEDDALKIAQEYSRCMESPPEIIEAHSIFKEVNDLSP